MLAPSFPQASRSPGRWWACRGKTRSALSGAPQTCHHIIMSSYQHVNVENNQPSFKPAHTTRPSTPAACRERHRRMEPSKYLRYINKQNAIIIVLLDRQSKRYAAVLYLFVRHPYCCTRKTQFVNNNNSTAQSDGAAL